MRARKKLLLAFTSSVLLSALTTYFAPFLIARGVAGWLRFEAQRSGLTIDFGEITAPFFRPVEIQNLRLSSAGLSGAHLEITAPRVEATLSLAAILHLPVKTRPIRTLKIGHLRALLRSRALETTRGIDASALASILPASFEISADEIRLEQSLASVELRDARIAAGPGKDGTLAIDSLKILAPHLQKSFASLHGAARWQDNRLSIGSLRLVEGLTVDSFSIDLNRVGDARVSAESSVTAFGGHLRANLATERNAQNRLWDAAGTATEISLAPLAGALGLSEDVRGQLRASKFTFRGDPRDFLRATSSVWLELIDFTWRNRNASSIMLGANFYNRTVQLQEFYIKQLHNEFNLSGESALTSDWLNPDFRGDISASINDLGEFAELLGAPRAAFAGKISARGRVHTHERNIDGELALTGDALKFFHAPVDSLTARVAIDSSRVRLDQLELKRAHDFLRATGAIDFARRRQFEFTTEISCQRFSDYAPPLASLGKIYGAVSGKLSARGNEENYRAELAFTGNDLICDRFQSLRPLTLNLAGQFSPDAIFLSQFGLTNEHMTTEMMINATRKFLQIQNLKMTLDEKEAAYGEFYLPLDGVAFLRGETFQLDRQAPLSVNFQLEPLSLTDAGRAIVAGPPPSGSFAAHVQFWKTLSQLEGEMKLELRDFVSAKNSPARLDSTVEGHAFSGSLDGRLEIDCGHSSPINATFLVPFNHPADSWRQQLLFAQLDFPAVYLEELPAWFDFAWPDGIASGQLATAGTLSAPTAIGDFSLLDLKFKSGSERLALSAQMRARGDSAAIDFLNLTRDQTTVTFSGELVFADLTNPKLTLTATASLRVIAEETCFDGIGLAPGDDGVPFTQLSIANQGAIFKNDSAPAFVAAFCTDDKGGAPLRINVPRPPDLWSTPPPVP